MWNGIEKYITVFSPPLLAHTNKRSINIQDDFKSPMTEARVFTNGSKIYKHPTGDFVERNYSTPKDIHDEEIGTSTGYDPPKSQAYISSSIHTPTIISTIPLRPSKTMPKPLKSTSARNIAF